MQLVSELNKEKVRLFIDAVLNQGHHELIDELIAADYAGHIPCLHHQPIRREELHRLLTDHHHAHPDLYIKIDDEIAEGDLVAIRWRATTTTPGTLTTTDHPPCASGIAVIRLLAGKQVDAHTALVTNAMPLVA